MRHFKITALIACLSFSMSLFGTESESLNDLNFAEAEKDIRQNIEKGSLDDASGLLEKTLTEFNALSDKDKSSTKKTFRQLPFDLAEAYKNSPDEKNTPSNALKWYEIYSDLQLYAKSHPPLSEITPYFSRQQKKHAYILQMAMKECENKPHEVRRKYPKIAESWAPFLFADLDGDGVVEIVSDNSEPYDYFVMNVFSFDGSNVKVFPFEDKRLDRNRFITIEPNESGGKSDYIVLKSTISVSNLGLDLNMNPPEAIHDWEQIICKIKFNGKRLYTSEFTHLTWDREPMEAGDPYSIQIAIRLAESRLKTGNLDEAYKGLLEAVGKYPALTDNEKIRLSEPLRLLLFELAEKYKELGDADGARRNALKMYDAYSKLQFEADRHPAIGTVVPYFFNQQAKYSYVLEMVMAECGNEPSRIKEQYPHLAASWAPLAKGDLFGDGNFEIVSDNACPWGNDRTILNIFYFKKGEALSFYNYKYDYNLPFISVSDDDKDGKDEIFIRNEPRRRCLGFDRTKDPPDVVFKWYQTTLIIKFDGKDFILADQRVQTWDEEPKDFPK